MKVCPRPIIAIDMVGRLTEYVESQGIDTYVMETNGWNQDVWNTVQKFLKKRENLVIFCNKDMTQSDKRSFMDKLSRALLESQYRRFLLIVDEVHEVIPEKTGERALEFERLIRTGGNRQIGVMFTTQRPQIVNKDVLALADIYVVFRIVWGGDLKVLGELLEYHLKSKKEVDAHLRRIQDFQQGQYQIYEFVREK